MSRCGGEYRTRVETSCCGGVRYITDAEAEDLIASGVFVEVAREGIGGSVRVLRDVVPQEVEARAAAARTHGQGSDVRAGFALMKERNVRLFWCECGVSWHQPDDGKRPVECPSCQQAQNVVRGRPRRRAAAAR